MLIEKRWLHRQIKLHAFVGEAIFLIGLLAVLNLAFWPAMPGFRGMEPNPFWLVILLMVARYGFRAGLWSSMLASGTYLALIANRLSGDFLTYRDLLAWTYAKPAVLFITVGIVLGMLVQRHKDRIAQLESEHNNLLKMNQALKRGEEELRDVNEELANRVVGATDTLPLLYKYAKKLNDLDMDAIFTTLTELVVEVIKAAQVSLYRVEDHRLYLHSRNGRPAENRLELRLESQLLTQLINQKKILTLHDLLGQNIRQKDFFLGGPLRSGATGAVMAVLIVEELEFLHYNPATIRLFQVVVDWACTSLEKAAQYQNRPAALQEEQNKAKRWREHHHATLRPGLLSAPAVRAAAGIIQNMSPGDVVLPPPTNSPLPSEPSRSSISLAPAQVSVSPSSASSLGQLLDQTSEQLFNSASPKISSSDGSGQDFSSPSMADLQHLLNGELKIASNIGSPLAKLLTEIDGYVTGRGGSHS